LHQRVLQQSLTVTKAQNILLNLTTAYVLRIWGTAKKRPQFKKLWLEVINGFKFYSVTILTYVY